MQEKAKTNKLENIIEWIITIIFTIALFVYAFLFAIDMANASEIPSNIWEYLQDDLLDNNADECITYLKQYVDDSWDFQYIDGVNNNLESKFVIFTNNQYIDFSNFYYSGGYLTEWFNRYTNNGSNYMNCVTSDKGNLITTPIKVYYLYVNENGYRLLYSEYSTTYTTSGNNKYYTRNSSWGGQTQIMNNLSSLYSLKLDVNSTIYYNHKHTYGYRSTGSWWYGISSTGTDIATLARPLENTSGFNVFIYNDLGIDYIRFVPNGLVTVGSHYSNNPTISFDMVLNNEVTIPVTYDESAGYYFESIEYSKAYYEIPVIELLPSSIADFDNIYITNVVYTNEWSNPSESGTDKFYYVDKCWLKRTYNNEEIGQVSIPYESTDTGYSQQEITDIYNMITNASTLEGTFDVEKNLSGGSSSPISFSSFQDAVVNTIECYHVTGTKTSDWSHIEIDYPPISVDSGDNMYWLNYNGNISGSFNSRYSYYCSPYSYVRENNYSGYYDIVYFIVHEMVYDESGNIAQYSDLSTTYTKYYYFISYRYYNKLILYREMDILEYLKLGNEGQEKIYDYLFYKINNIDDNAYHFFKDKLNIDNDIVDKIKEIDNSITLSTDSIMDLLNRILDALLDIDIQPVEPMDITPIVTRLDQILEKQTTSNLNNDWYKNFRQWLYEETDNNLLDTPHEWFIDKLPSIKLLYNIFGGHDTTFYYTPMMNVINGYIHGQDLLNDETTYSTFYYKGTWSDGFNTSNFDSYHISNNNEVQ